MDIYNKKAAIEKEYKLLRRRVKMPRHGIVNNYPTTPSELKVMSEVVYNNAFPAGGSDVVACAVEDLLVNRLRMRMACRSNRSSIKDTWASNAKGAHTPRRAWAPKSARKHDSAHGSA
eukprot:7926972-Pyramimonas_sp.AAC.1